MNRTSLALKSVSAALLIHLFIPYSAFSADPIPDEIDTAKYSNVYLTAKGLSDQKRAQTADLLKETQRLNAMVQIAQSNLQAKQTQITDTQNTIAQLERESPSLQAQNDSLNQETIRHQSDLRGHQIILGQVFNDLAKINQQIPAAQADANSLRRNYDLLNSRYAVLLRDLESKKTERDQSVNALNRSREQQRDLKVSSTQLGREIDQFTREIQALPAQIQRLSQSLAVQAREVARLEQSVNIRSAEIQPLRARVQTAERAAQSAQGAHRLAQSNAERASRALNEVDSKINQFQAQADGAARAIREKTAELSSAQASLSQADAELNGLNTQKVQLKTTIDRLNGEIRTLSNESHALDQDIREKMFRLVRLRLTNPSAVPALQKEIERLKQKVENNRNLERDKKNEQRLAEQSHDRIEKQIDRNARTNQQMRARVASLPREIQANVREQESANQQLSSLKPQRPQLAQRNQQAQSALTETQRAHSVAQQEVTASSNALNQALPQLKQAQAQLQVAQQKHKEMNQEYLVTQKQLTQAQERSPVILARRREQLDQLRRLENHAPALEARVQKDQRELDDLGRNVNVSYAQLTNLHNQLETSGNYLDDLTRRQAAGNARVVELNQGISDLQNRIHSNGETIAYNMDKIRWNTQQIAQLTRDLPALQAETPRLSSLLAQANASATQAQSVYKQADEGAARAESDTLAKYNQYLAVQRTYDQRLASAQAAGSAEGLAQGRPAGREAGTNEGTLQGTQKGRLEGRVQGLEAGFQRGKGEGDAKGYSDGYAQGGSTGSDYQTGYAAGLLQGDQDAAVSAVQTDFPKGQAAKRAELLAATLTRIVQLDNSKVDLVLGGRTFLDAAPKSGSAMKSFTLAKPAGEFFVTLNEGELVPVADDVARISVYSVGQFKSANCTLGYVDFNQACQQAYEQSFQSAYDEGYRESHPSAYSAAFESGRQAAFNENKNERYKEGFDLAYAPGYSRGTAAGARDAQSKGFVDGKSAGFQRSIVSARVAEFGRGQAEVVTQFETNPVLVFNDAQAVRIGQNGDTGGSAVAGDTLSLSIQISNFGKRASQRGAIQVKWESLSDNVSVDNQVANLVGIPAQTRADISSVATAKISTQAVRGGKARLRVTVIMPDRQIRQQELTLDIAAHVITDFAKFKVKTDPRINKKQRIETEVRNISDIDSTEQLRMVVTTDAPASAIRLDRPEVMIDPLRAGKKVDANLFFTVLSEEALAQGIALRVTVYHGSNVSNVQDILLKK